MSLFRFGSPRSLQGAGLRQRTVVRVTAAVAAALTVPLVAAGCSHGSGPVHPTPSPKPDSSASSTHEAPPPSALPTHVASTHPTSPPPPPPPSHPFTRTPQVLFLDYDGGTFRNCSNQCESPETNQSFIIGQGFGLDHYTFAPYPQADRPTTTAEVEKIFAPWNVKVVTQRPTSGPYEMAVVSPSDPPRAPHGISYVDCGNERQSEILFVMRTSDAYTQEDLAGNGISGPTKVGVEIAHEDGHNLGEDHQDAGVMTTDSRGDKFATAGRVDDGTGTSCTTASTFSSSAVLDKVLGRRG